MTFLRNAWYAAAWQKELGENILARTFLNEPVALYRDEDGNPIALADRCPHRFAPLSAGKKIGNEIQCPYHGLRFDRTGQCVFNHHGSVPKAARVRAYPLMERYGVVWIWMGDPAAAEAERLPEFPPFDGRKGWTTVEGYLSVGANYQLVIDNLLDLSHGQFLHPFLGNPDSSDRLKFKVKTTGNTVWAYNHFPGEPITKFHQLMWTSKSVIGDRRAHMRWDAPSNLWLDVGVTECGRTPEEGVSLPAAHLLTPETEHTTHYFWMSARNAMIDDTELSKKIRAGIDHAFRFEDEPVVVACEDRMNGVGFDALAPVYLSGDRAAGRARQILAALIAGEQGDTPSQ